MRRAASCVGKRHERAGGSAKADVVVARRPRPVRVVEAARDGGALAGGGRGRGEHIAAACVEVLLRLLDARLRIGHLLRVFLLQRLPFLVLLLQFPKLLSVGIDGRVELRLPPLNALLSCCESHIETALLRLEDCPSAVHRLLFLGGVVGDLIHTRLRCGDPCLRILVLLDAVRDLLLDILQVLLGLLLKLLGLEQLLARILQGSLRFGPLVEARQCCGLGLARHLGPMAQVGLLLLKLTLRPGEGLRLRRKLRVHEACELHEQPVVLLLQLLGLHIELLVDPLVLPHVRILLRQFMAERGSSAHRVHGLLGNGLQMLSPLHGSRELHVQVPELCVHAFELVLDKGVRRRIELLSRLLRRSWLRRGRLLVLLFHGGRLRGVGALDVACRRRCERRCLVVAMVVVVVRAMVMVAVVVAAPEASARYLLLGLIFLWGPSAVCGGDVVSDLVNVLCGSLWSPTTCQQRNRGHGRGHAREDHHAAEWPGNGRRAAIS
mmetsp:Transcript_104391/g.301984  ORF Transcript_104391/g.301984 Transcript_104391/m.301984 type:complete len:493 (-) Transcript_104391:183-1661(-)